MVLTRYWSIKTLLITLLKPQIEEVNQRGVMWICFVHIVLVSVGLTPTLCPQFWRVTSIEQSDIKNSDSEAISINRTPDEVLLNDCNDFIDNRQEQSETCPDFPPDLSMEQQQDFNDVLRKFESLFSTKPGLTNFGTHKILVKPDITPVKCNPYRKSPDNEKKLRHC